MNSIVYKILFSISFASTLGLWADEHYGTEPEEPPKLRPVAVSEDVPLNCGAESNDVLFQYKNAKGETQKLHLKFNNSNGGFSAYLQFYDPNSYFRDQMFQKIHFNPLEGYILTTKQATSKYSELSKLENANYFVDGPSNGSNAAMQTLTQLRKNLNAFLDEALKRESAIGEKAKPIISCLVRTLNSTLAKYPVSEKADSESVSESATTEEDAKARYYRARSTENWWGRGVDVWSNHWR